MSAKLLSAVAVSCVLVLVSYRYYVPIPEDFERPMLVGFHMGVQKFMLDCCMVLSAISGHRVSQWKHHTLEMHMGSDDMSDDDIQIEDVVMSGVPVRIYTPTSAVTSSQNGEGGSSGGGAPAVVFYHGGGFIFGSIRMYHKLVRTFALETNVKFFSVEYRYTPDHVFPVPHDDCLTATHHILHHAHSYGVDPHRVAVMGDSAGGHLAATVSQALRSAALKPAAQILIYPWLQFIDHLTSSYQAYGASGLVLVTDDCVEATQYYLLGEKNDTVSELIRSNAQLSRKVRTELTEKYLNYKTLPAEFIPESFIKPDLETITDEPPLSKEVQELFIDPRACPLCADDVSGVPPAYIYTAHYDMMRDDGVFYARRLQHAGVDVEHVHQRPSYHAVLFHLVEGVPEAQLCFDSVANYIKQKL